MRDPDPMDQLAATLACLRAATPSPVLRAIAGMAAGALLFGAGMVCALFLP